MEEKTPGMFTLSIIKPNAVEKENIGEILCMIKAAGFKLVAIKMVQLSEKEAQRFYDVHRGRPFVDSLVSFMTSRPIIAFVLKKENAVKDYRTLVGNTDPSLAEEGTIRKLFAESKERNAVHASDSDENAKNEVNFFFSAREIYSSI